MGALPEFASHPRADRRRFVIPSHTPGALAEIVVQPTRARLPPCLDLIRASTS
jgi:hypothetical protein